MARGKKKESTLTPEEKLAQALVHDWEQPYKVPKNWIWSYIRSGYEVTSSKRVHKDDWLSEGVPFYRTRELVKLSEHGHVDNELFISEEQYEEYKTTYGVPQIGDLLISGVGTIGVPYIVNSEEKFYFKDGNVIWFRNKGLFLSQYIYYLYKSLFMDNQIHEMSSGTTVDTYTIINANNTMVPVPPHAEQKRIVDRIEYLFAKLDEAKEKAQSVLDSFETRKAAILHKAFTGELTAKWRTEHGIGMDTWKHHAFCELCADIVRGGSPRPAGSPEFYDGPIPFMKVADITRNNSPYVSSAEYSIKEAGLKKTRMVNANTLLLTNSGATLGVPAICTFETTFNDGIAAFLGLPEDTLLFYYYFWTSKTSDLRAINKGAAQPNLNTTIIGDVEIDVPSDLEKYEIVRVLESLFTKEEQAKEAAEAVLEKIDLLKKSILARAFRGELGTNDPSEESALELLKSISGLPKEDKSPVKRVFISHDLENRINTDLERKIVKLFLQKNIDALPVSRLMSVSSEKFDVMEALRNLQQRGVLAKEKNKYILLR